MAGKQLGYEFKDAKQSQTRTAVSWRGQTRTPD